MIKIKSNDREDRSLIKCLFLLSVTLVGLPSYI